MSSANPLAERLRLVVIVDPEACEHRSPLEVARAALQRGAPSIQLRAKGWGARRMCELAHELRWATRDLGALFFVNDRLDVALAAGADGVHVGDDDLPLEAVRSLTPASFVVGRSAATLEEAAAAVAGGADYLGVGAIYDTLSKADAGAAIGTARLREIAAAVPIPVVGIGGIDTSNAAAVMETGAAGVAVIRAVCARRDPAEVVRSLLSAVAEGTSRPIG